MRLPIGCLALHAQRKTGRMIMVSEVQVDNGVNVAALLAAREALTNAPEAANFKWRATCNWENGTHSHSTVESFFGP